MDLVGQGLAEKVRPMVKDTVFIMYEAIKAGNKKILIEGANAQMLDLDFGVFRACNGWLLLREGVASSGRVHSSVPKGPLPMRS